MGVLFGRLLRYFAAVGQYVGREPRTLAATIEAVQNAQGLLADTATLATLCPVEVELAIGAQQISSLRVAFV